MSEEVTAQVNTQNPQPDTPGGESGSCSSLVSSKEISQVDDAQSNTSKASNLSMETGDSLAGDNAATDNIQLTNVTDCNKFSMNVEVTPQSTPIDLSQAKIAEGQETENTLTSEDLVELCRADGITIYINKNDQVPSPAKDRQQPLPSNNDTHDSGNLAKKSKKTASSGDSSVSAAEAHIPKKVNIYTEDHYPHWYETHPNMSNISRPIVPSRLPEAFQFLTIFSQPHMIKEFVGAGLNDEEFAGLEDYCNVDILRTGKELDMDASYPGAGLFNEVLLKKPVANPDEHELCIVKKCKIRMEKDSANGFTKSLKYRGIRILPLTQEDNSSTAMAQGPPLQPGKDIIFHIRIYRPFHYHKLKSQNRGRHSTFSCDLVMLGRHRLTELRDRFVCANDIGMRVDISGRIEQLQLASAKDLFPSGFLFINNVFYVDTRPGCSDMSQRIREWAAHKRGLGNFPCKDMGSVRLDELVCKLGHPEVYVHQGNCEHLFTISEIRLVSATDPLQLHSYPCHTAISQNQTVYCTTCAEFGAKFIVTGCSRVPFDPAFFCETCLNLYLYKDGQKIGDFKAYYYRGNETHTLKPQ